jgi:hypothetical protein
MVGAPDAGGRTGSGLRVLYVAGWGRSGSTVLSRVVGGPGVVGLGEVRWVWRRGVLARQTCSCGAAWDGCPVWRPAIEAATEGVAHDPVEAAERLDALSTAAYRAVERGRRSHPAVGDYAAVLGRLYRALAEAAGADVLVDSSKATGPALLARRSGIDTTVLQMVRDPRAVVWSHGRAKAPPEGIVADVSPVHRPSYVAARWLARNAAVDLHVRPDVRLRYEDVVDAPDEARRVVFGALGLPVPSGPDLEHGIAGNPGRFGSGPLTLTADLEWVDRQPAGQRRVSTALALPLLHRYGYPVRP